MIVFNLWKTCFELKLTLKSFVFTYIRDPLFLLHKVSAQRALSAINWLLLSKEEYLIIKAKKAFVLCKEQVILNEAALYHIIYQFKMCLY